MVDTNGASFIDATRRKELRIEAHLRDKDLEKINTKLATVEGEPVHCFLIAWKSLFGWPFVGELLVVSIAAVEASLIIIRLDPKLEEHYKRTFLSLERGNATSPVLLSSHQVFPAPGEFQPRLLFFRGVI